MNRFDVRETKKGSNVTRTEFGRRGEVLKEVGGRGRAEGLGEVEGLEVIVVKLDLISEFHGKPQEL